MKRDRPQNLAATVFIFERKTKPFTTHAVYLDMASCYPAMWIENLLNNPTDKEQQIESLCHK